MAKSTTLKKAGKATVKKAAAKKTAKSATRKAAKPAKTSAVKTTKKSPAVKKAGTKPAAKKLNKAPKSVGVKQKSTDKRTERKSTMAKKKKTEEAQVIIQPEVSAAEARAKAMEKIKGYSKKDLEHFRQIILEKRDEIIEQLQNLRDQMLDPTTGEYINENSPYSLHMAEQGTDAMEREKTFLYAQRENKFLGYLEDALKRIDTGTYGICIECIEEPQHLCETCPLVPKARLEAVPHSQLCLPIKQRQEKR
ncbi:MAG: conjugal transfer protein TraR [Ignavibacteriaceae bacterium]